VLDRGSSDRSLGKQVLWDSGFFARYSVRGGCEFKSDSGTVVGDLLGKSCICHERIRGALCGVSLLFRRFLRLAGHEREF
jgi:hypothetical protein